MNEKMVLNNDNFYPKAVTDQLNNYTSIDVMESDFASKLLRLL